MHCLRQYLNSTRVIPVVFSVLGAHKLLLIVLIRTSKIIEIDLAIENSEKSYSSLVNPGENPSPHVHQVHS